MKHIQTKILPLGLLLLLSMNFCGIEDKRENREEKIWRLGWAMIENSWEEEYGLAEMQFDSLLSLSNGLSLGERFLRTGLEVKSKLSKDEEVHQILSEESVEVRTRICRQKYAADFEICRDIPEEQIENRELQREIINMFVDDQAVRRNTRWDLITKYQVDSTQIKTEDMSWVDEQNRNQLKEIIEEFGFPNLQLIGQDAMHGVFFIIQHSDGDTEWQKSQLPNIERAVANGDLEDSDYAYLYDRIQVNSRKKQRYGTQFSKVDPKTNTIELQETEDLDNLDKRRRSKGLIPIEMYKRLMIKNSGK